MIWFLTWNSRQLAGNEMIKWYVCLYACMEYKFDEPVRNVKWKWLLRSVSSEFNRRLYRSQRWNVFMHERVQSKQNCANWPLTRKFVKISRWRIHIIHIIKTHVNTHTPQINHDNDNITITSSDEYSHMTEV